MRTGLSLSLTQQRNRLGAAVDPFNGIVVELLADNAVGSGTASGITDTSGNGNDAVSQAAPTIVLNDATIGGHTSLTFNDSAWLTQPATGLATLFLVAKANGTLSPFVGTTGTADDLRYMLCTNWNLDTPALYTSEGQLNDTFSEDARWHVLSTRHDGTNVRFYIDGFFVLSAVSALPVEPFQIGMGFGSFKAKGSFASLHGFDTQLALPAYHLADDAIAATFGITKTAQILCDGNSMTRGVGAVFLSSYVAQLATSLGANYAIRNLGVDGQTTAQMTAGVILTWDTQKPAYVGAFIVIYWEGTNSIFFGATGAQAYADLVAYGAARNTAGQSPILMDVLPRGSDAGFETQRSACNVLLAADFTVATANPYVWLAGPGVTYARALVRLSLQPDIGPAGSQSDTDFYDIDETHLTAAGYEIVADLAEVAIHAIGS